LALGKEKTLGKQASLPRAKQKAFGTEKNTRQRFLYQEPTGWLSAKNFFAKCNFLTLAGGLCHTVLGSKKSAIF
jgi:hypothetical protein